eukprot:UN2541
MRSRDLLAYKNLETQAPLPIRLGAAPQPEQGRHSLEAHSEAHNREEHGSDGGAGRGQQVRVLALHRGGRDCKHLRGAVREERPAMPTLAERLGVARGEEVHVHL